MDLFFVEPTAKGEDMVACCPTNVYEKDLEEWQNTLIGNFLGWHPSFAFVKDSAPKIWRLKGSIDVTMMESGLFVFKFNCTKEKHKVLEGICTQTSNLATMETKRGTDQDYHGLSSSVGILTKPTLQSLE